MKLDEVFNFVILDFFFPVWIDTQFLVSRIDTTLSTHHAL